MSPNAFEANLLENKKDEIWQLMYIHRQSEREAYATLTCKEGLEWLGKQTFREIISKWQREEPKVWPARPEYWGTDGYPSDEVDCAYQSCKDGIGLYDEVSRIKMKTLDQRQSYNHGEILDDPRAHEDKSLEQRRSPTDTLRSLRDAGYNKNNAPKINNKEWPYLNPPLNAQNLPVYHSQEEPQQSRAGSWLLNIALDSDALPSTMPNLLSQSIYCSAYPKSLFHDCREDDILKPLFARDASSSYIGQPSVQQKRKPVTQIFGFFLDADEDEQSPVSDDVDDDEYLSD